MTATGERYQLTGGKKSSSGPVWSPDSRRLAFTSDRDGKRQIYVIAPTGGEAAQLTNEEAGIGALAWSPDGASIAFSSAGPDDKAVKDRKERFGDFEIVGGDYRMSHLWLLKVPAEIPADSKKLPKPEALTRGDPYARALLVDYQYLGEMQSRGELIRAEECMKDAYLTDVRPLLGELRAEIGRDPDPLESFRKSGYMDKVKRERSS